MKHIHNKNGRVYGKAILSSESKELNHLIDDFYDYDCVGFFYQIEGKRITVGNNATECWDDYIIDKLHSIINQCKKSGIVCNGLFTFCKAGDTHNTHIKIINNVLEEHQHL